MKQRGLPPPLFTMLVSKPNLCQTYTKLQWLPKHTKAKFQTDILRHYMILPALSCFVTRGLALSTRVPAQWMLFLDQEKCIVVTIGMRHHEIVLWNGFSLLLRNKEKIKKRRPMQKKSKPHFEKSKNKPKKSKKKANDHFEKAKTKPKTNQKKSKKKAKKKCKTKAIKKQKKKQNKSKKNKCKKKTNAKTTSPCLCSRL